MPPRRLVKVPPAGQRKTNPLERCMEILDLLRSVPDGCAPALVKEYENLYEELPPEQQRFLSMQPLKGVVIN